MTRYILLASLAAACTTTPLEPWPDAAAEVAAAFCDRCAPSDDTCFERAFDSWTTDDAGRYIGDDLPDVDPEAVDACVADLAALPTCDGYTLPDTCLDLARSAGGGGGS